MSSRFERDRQPRPSTRARSSRSATTRFRHEDGEEVDARDRRATRARSASSCLDGDRLWLVRQPREAVGAPDLLEIPAGKLDEEGEDPLETAKRELAEEIGKQRRALGAPRLASTPRPASPTRRSTSSSPPASPTSTAPEVEEDERIDVEVRPLAELDAIIAESQDSKTLIGAARARGRLPRR